MTYAAKFLLATDIWVNVGLCNGNPGETISARVQRASDAHHGWKGIYKRPLILLAKLLVGGLNLLQAHHGIGAEHGDLARAEFIVGLETSVLTSSLAIARATVAGA